MDCRNILIFLKFSYPILPDESTTKMTSADVALHSVAEDHYENITMEYMGHYQKMEQSLSLMVFSQARCPRFAFSMYNISFRGALLEPHAISRFRVRYLQKRDARSAILSIFTVSLGQGK